MRRTSSKRRSGCPVSQALELFGDPWSLLIVRDLMFRAQNTFEAFAAAGECMATNVLADRLARLQRAGIITRHRDPDDGRRVSYRLTAKGRDLAPVILEIVVWSAKYNDTEAPPALVKRMRNDRDGVIAALRAPENGLLVG